MPFPFTTIDSPLLLKVSLEIVILATLLATLFSSNSVISEDPAELKAQINITQT